MAQIGVSTEVIKKIFPTKKDTIKAFIIIILAFVFGGFQAAIYGMLTVPVSAHFGIHASMIVFYDSFGLWGQIIAMAIGGLVISRIKAKNTLLLSGIFMVIASLGAIWAPNIYVYTSMTLLGSFAVGFILVSCYYMAAGTAGEGESSEARLSFAAAFFSIGYMISPAIVSVIIAHMGWQSVFAFIVVLFIIFLIVLFCLNVTELIDKHAASGKRAKTEICEKESFITAPLIITAITFFLLLYVEQVMYYFSQPYLMLNLKFAIEVSGLALSSFGVAQLVGRFVIGKFILPKVKPHKYIIIAAIIYAILYLIFLNTSAVEGVIIIFVLLGLVDSCMYPCIMGYGLDQIGHASPKATSFMITIGSLGIPIGTMCCGLIGEHVNRVDAILVAPALLIIMAILTFIAYKIFSNKRKSI